MKNEELADAIRGKFEIMSGIRRDVHWVGIYIAALCVSFIPQAPSPWGGPGRGPAVIYFPIFSPTRVWTFGIFSAAGANIASTGVSKIRGIHDVIFTYFSTSSLSTTYKQQHFRCPATAARRSCRKGLTGLQRGPYGNATRPPLHSQSSPAVLPGGPYGKKSGTFPDKFRGLKRDKICDTETQ